MQVFINSNNFEMTEALSLHIKNRIEFTLSRFGGLVKKIVVSVSDENGPKGGVDKSCVIRIQTDTFSELVVKDKKSDVYAAVGRAIARAKHSLTKQVNRSKFLKRKNKRLQNESIEQSEHELELERDYQYF